MAPLALPRKAIKCGEDRGRGVLFESYDHLHIIFFKTIQKEFFLMKPKYCKILRSKIGDSYCM